MKRIGMILTCLGMSLPALAADWVCSTSDQHAQSERSGYRYLARGQDKAALMAEVVEDCRVQSGVIFPMCPEATCKQDTGNPDRTRVVITKVATQRDPKTGFLKHYYEARRVNAQYRKIVENLRTKTRYIVVAPTALEGWAHGMNECLDDSGPRLGKSCSIRL